LLDGEAGFDEDLIGRLDASRRSVVEFDDDHSRTPAVLDAGDATVASH
jgi:hypothetical protein